MNIIVEAIQRMESNGSIPSVEILATELKEAIDNLSANTSTEQEVIKVIKTITSDKKKRLKILDGNQAKSKFAALMGKGRLTKFYPLLEKAEK
jgi:serine/threonine-protein kinase RIO1